MDPETEKSPPIGINYLYFGAFFTVLLLISESNIFIRENLGGSRFFFFFYALGQAALETLLLIFIGWITRKFLGSSCFIFFIGATFLGLIIHLLDFMMDRILDLSIWETVSFVLDESFANFILMLDASGVPLWAWIFIFAILLTLPAIGMAIYKASEFLTNQKPFRIHYEWFLQAFLCIPCALLLWDFSASRMIHPDAYTAFIKSLPWKFTLLQPKNVLLNLPGSIHELASEKKIAQAIDESPILLTNKPNIYLFVIESLREDFITPEIAPFLNQFKKDHIHFDHSFSNANATFMSWFSIFHSQFPYYWNKRQKEGWTLGSPALKLLKKLGYEIRLYTSAQLSYYGMEELLFGKDLNLLTARQLFHHTPPLEAADTDAAAIFQLQKDIAENSDLQQGQVFIIFWDSTHFNYSWPQNWTPKFIPFAKEFGFLRAFHTDKSIDLIKNRYRNAINYTDSLFGNFLDHLPRKEEAVIVVTGDHGEEFFEQGHLFHQSHLSNEQTRVPLYFKFGKGERPIPNRTLVSQMDIFSSIADYLLGSPVSFLEGESIFQNPKWPYAMIARFNGCRAPYEFCIHNGRNKMIAQFLNRSNIFQARTLQILSLRTAKDKSLAEGAEDVEGWIDGEFGGALDRLFGPPKKPAK